MEIDVFPTDNYGGMSIEAILPDGRLIHIDIAGLNKFGGEAERFTNKLAKLIPQCIDNDKKDAIKELV